MSDGGVADHDATRQQRLERLMRHKNKLDSQLTSEYYKWARKQCEDVIEVAVKCRNEAGLLAGFKCRDEHRAINACLSVYSKDEARMKEFKERRIAEIVDLGIGAAAGPDE